MKKFIFIFAALFLGLSQVSAQEIYVENFTAPEGGVQKFDVKYRGIGNKTIQGYIFKFEFPEGLSLVTEETEEEEEEGGAIFEFGEDNPNTKFDVKTTATGVQASPSSKTSKLSGSEGTLLTLTLKVNDPLVQGNTATVKVYDASLTEKVENTDGTSSYKDLDTNPFTFEVEIVDKYTTLSENETEAPAAMENVNIRVERTIKADIWNTICLPFDMDAGQLKAAFGDDVQLAEFAGCDATYASDTDEYAQSIKVKFSSVDALSKNIPYLIKVSNKVTAFTLDGVNVEPAAEDDLVVAKDEVKVSRTQYTYNYFIGTYVAGTNVPKGDLYLSGNKFYFSKGGSTLKAFRGYFEFETNMIDVQSELGAKISVSVDGEETTAIDGMNFQRMVEGVYDLSGRKIQIEGNDLNKLQKGVYIIDGKKVTIK